MLQYLFLLLPVAATCGWCFGRRKPRESSARITSNMRSDYFKGLNYLINEQPDKAVDVFIRLLEVDTDTVETHLALGSLFRRRGEVDRAIRVHQNLIARPQLAKEHRLQALSALGQDYLSAGVLDRAERLFLELVELGEENQSSLNFLLHIYQQEKDWEKAIKIAQKISNSAANMNIAIAQYYCELALEMIEKGRVSQALSYLKKANSTDAACARASLIKATVEIDQQQYREAIRTYKRAITQDSDYISEVVSPLIFCYEKISAEDKMVEYFKNCLEKYPRISLVVAISDYLKKKTGDKVAIEFLAKEIKRQPSLRGLSHLVQIYVEHSHGDALDKLTILGNFMQRWLEDKPVYRCVQCGFSGKTLYWLCPSCHHWGTSKPIQGLEGN